MSQERDTEHNLLCEFAEAAEELLSALSLADMTNDVRNAYVLLNNAMENRHKAIEAGVISYK